MRSVSNPYVKTLITLPVKDEWVATLTPYEHCDISEEGNYMVVEESPEMHIGPEKWKHTPGSIPFEKLQLCIKLDGELYVWKEWEL